MKKEAQNALLKSIEEPRDQTVFFLLTADASRLLPTVRSRAVKFKTEPLPKDVIREALKENKPASEISEEAILLCGGSLGRALEILGDAEFHAARQVVLKYFEALFSGASFTKLCLIVSPAEWSRAKFSIILPMVKLALRDLICAHFGFDFSPEFFTNSAFLHDFAEIISPTEAIRLYEMTEALEGATEQNANLYAMLSTFHLRFQKLTQSLA